MLDSMSKCLNWENTPQTRFLDLVKDQANTHANTTTDSRSSLESSASVRTRIVGYIDPWYKEFPAAGKISEVDQAEQVWWRVPSDRCTSPTSLDHQSLTTLVSFSWKQIGFTLTIHCQCISVNLVITLRTVRRPTRGSHTQVTLRKPHWCKLNSSAACGSLKPEGKSFS